MVTTRSIAAMEECIDSLERQMAEFRAEQGRFMEAMLKRIDELMASRMPNIFYCIFLISSNFYIQNYTTAD